MRPLPYRTGPASAAVVLALVMAGTSSCADGGPTPPRTPATASPRVTGAPSTTAPTRPSGTEFPEDLPTPVGSSGKATGSVTVRGTVEPGVESGCLLLGKYLLLGGPRDVLQAGRTVTVTGRPVPDQMTTCQQGLPFRVERATG